MSYQMKKTKKRLYLSVKNLEVIIVATGENVWRPQLVRKEHYSARIWYGSSGIFCQQKDSWYVFIPGTKSKNLNNSRKTNHHVLRWLQPQTFFPNRNTINRYQLKRLGEEERKFANLWK